MNEQQEKVNKAATGEEESRYSQRTMADLRANLDGTTAIYGLFRDWLEVEARQRRTALGRPSVDASITAGLHALEALYAASGRRDPAAARDLERGEPVGRRPRDAVRHAVPGGPRRGRSGERRLGRGPDEHGAMLLGIPVVLD